ncbi:hypothetical protein G9C98_005303 [Cotesia typhae]|uniref:Uncharacterized protein n=1 Tax=Cotesia typhae TaxID=2053667 RepID=A0A8J5RLS2_9HYME|nr:hypothetical protein G9C98_005303 [Cotesia typhae]
MGWMRSGNSRAATPMEHVEGYLHPIHLHNTSCTGGVFCNIIEEAGIEGTDDEDQQAKLATTTGGCINSDCRSCSADHGDNSPDWKPRIRKRSNDYHCI